MSVVAEALSVIVRQSTLDSLYPGGTPSYEAACPNKTFCADENLTRIGFMSPARVEEWVAHLTALGLVHVRGYDLIDIAVVDQNDGYVGNCDWLEGGIVDGSPRVWLAGRPPGELAAPRGWKPDQHSRLVKILPSEVRARVLPLGPAGNVHVFLDYKTGRVMYTPDEIETSG